MHGRIKVRTTEEQAEAKRQEQQEKLKVYRRITSKIFEKREKEEYDEEGLELTGRILEQNPDFYTFWNYRREILLHFKTEKNKEELKQLAVVELGLTQNCLKTNPKSYGAWHHRCWAMEFNPEADWKKELKLCGYFLTQDERNFHCWDYRRLAAKKCEVAPVDELNFSTELIETNFSNYSAWHYRSTLLPVIYPGPVEGSLDEEILLKELDLVQNAAFTDPDDQSVWFYHRWLLGRSKIPLQILNVSVVKPLRTVAVLLSEPIKVDHQCLKLQVNEVYLNVPWKTVCPFTGASTIWICDLPKDLDLENDKCQISIELNKGSENSSLSCCVNGSTSSAWKMTNRTDAFRSELSAATKEVLERELESCLQLNELEPNSKWTLFTSVLLMRALRDSKFQEQITEYMGQLKEVDRSRKLYYDDLGSKFAIENVIETLPVDATEVNLSNLKLRSLHHIDHFLLLEKIDLSSNRLATTLPLMFLISIKIIILDDNQLRTLDGLSKLQNLENLSVRNNLINDVYIIEDLKTCVNLQELCIENNPVVNHSNFLEKVKMLPALKTIDGVPL